MDQSSISQMAAVVVVSALLIVAGLSFLGHVGLEYRSEVTRRIDGLLRSAGKPKGALGSDATTSRSQSTRGALILPPRDQVELERRLTPLGIAPEWANVAFLGGRILLAVVFAAAMALAGSQYMLGFSLLLRIAVFAALGAAIGAYAPAMVLSSLARRRVDAVERGLADAVELLAVSVEAGISLEDGIERIAMELRRSQRALSDELSALAADLKLLPSQREALMNFAERVDRPSVRGVMTTLAQTMEYGTPLAQALRVTAGELRNEMMLKLEERANRLPVLLTVPMVVFLLPAIFLVVGGPAVIRLIDVLFR